MIIALKAVLLIAVALIVTPTVFLLFFGFLGNYFYLNIDRNSWFAKTEIRWIKRLRKKLVR